MSDYQAPKMNLGHNPLGYLSWALENQGGILPRILRLIDALILQTPVVYLDWEEGNQRCSKQPLSRTMPMGHYCRICGLYRANEKFSGKGHRTHICKDCSRLPVEERRFIEEEDEIRSFLGQSNISAKNLARLKVLAASPNSEIARFGKLVLEIGRAHPQKRGRLRFLARERRDLLAQLEETGLIYGNE